MEECIICFEEKNIFIFYPCSHKVCKTCFDKMEKKCPLCEVSCILIDNPDITYLDRTSPCISCCCYGSILLLFLYIINSAT